MLALRPSNSLALAARPRAGRTGRAAVATRAEAKSLGKTQLNEDSYKERFEFPLVGARVDLVAKEGTVLVPVTVKRPLGITFQGRALPVSRSKESGVVVEEVVEGSNAAGEDVAPGDVLRLTTAVFMDRKPLNELEYFSTVPKSFNRRAVFVADGQSFDKVMAALVSNGEQIDNQETGEKEEVGEISLILERAA